MGALIIIIGWMICSFLMFSNYLDEIMKIENEGAKWAIYAVFILGGPILVFNNLLVQILDIFMPEGWDDDDRF